MAGINTEVAEKNMAPQAGEKITILANLVRIRGFQTKTFADFRPDFGILPGQEL